MFSTTKPPLTGSSDVAKTRLSTVIFQDRLERSPDVLEHMKSEIIAVMANYVEFEEGDIEIDLWLPSGKVAGETPSLTASVPIKSWKKRHEEGV